MAGTFDITQYDMVDDRIKKFYEKNPKGRITTEIKKISDDFSTVVVKAKIWIDETMVSTGLAMETKGQGFVNRDAWLENCETSAIGRGLANFGISGKKRSSQEEMSKTVKEAVRPDGDFNKALEFFNEKCDDIPKINQFIQTLESKTWKVGEKEKLLMHSAEKKKSLTNVSQAAEKIAEKFDGEILPSGAI